MMGLKADRPHNLYTVIIQGLLKPQNMDITQNKQQIFFKQWHMQRKVGTCTWAMFTCVVGLHIEVLQLLSSLGLTSLSNEVHEDTATQPQHCTFFLHACVKSAMTLSAVRRSGHVCIRQQKNQIRLFIFFRGKNN